MVYCGTDKKTRKSKLQICNWIVKTRPIITYGAEKIINVIREKMNIKISILDYIEDTNSWTGMSTWKEWMKKGFLGKFWNGAHLEDEEKAHLEIRGCSK